MKCQDVRDQSATKVTTGRSSTWTCRFLQEKVRVEAVNQEFSSGLDPRWNQYVVGSSSLEPTSAGLRLINADTSSHDYTDAQIDDYQRLSRRRFPWCPPLNLTVRARFSHPAGELRGTAGFGFWNDPFMMTGGRSLPAPPQAIWFFYASPPSNMKLDVETPGNGWKASTLDATRLPFFLLLPTAPLAIPLMNIRSMYRILWPLGQRALGIHEAAVEAPMTQWHSYEIDWAAKEARFKLDGQEILRCASSPRGPLGFVMWLDNQYAIATPWGSFGHGLLETHGKQWMEVQSLSIRRG